MIHAEERIRSEVKRRLGDIKSSGKRHGSVLKQGSEEIKNRLEQEVHTTKVAPREPEPEPKADEVEVEINVESTAAEPEKGKHSAVDEQMERLKKYMRAKPKK